MITILRALIRFASAGLAQTAASLLRKVVVLVIFVAVLSGLLYLVQVVPELQVRRASVRSTAANPEAKTTPADVAAMQNEMRKTLIQVIGGAFALAALYFTYRRTDVAEQGHITDRYTKAIEQLGAVRADNQPNIEVRLGGIYALERIALDSERDQWTIVEVLTTYVRQNAPAPLAEPSVEENMAAIAKGPATDIQAILKVLGRRRRRKVYRDRYHLNLDNSDLRGADLKNLHLEHTHFEHSRLDGAQCRDAHLGGSSFKSARLRGASFNKANLPLANFTDAYLEKADLSSAHLDAADFTRTHAAEADFSYSRLAAARFYKANLEQAKFSDTHLKQTRFRGAYGLNINQFEDAKDWENASFDEVFKIVLRDAKTNSSVAGRDTEA